MGRTALVLGILCWGCAAPVEEGAVSSIEGSLFVHDETWPSIYIPTVTGEVRETPVPVCWQRASANGWEDGLRDLVRRSLRDTWERWSTVVFTGWQVCRPGEYAVQLGVVDERSYANDTGTDASYVSLNFEFSSFMPSCAASEASRAYCVRAIAVHEFGHVLGFAHEQNRDETEDVAGEKCAEAEQSDDGDYVTGAWDPHSVMNYCNVLWNNDGNLSAGDIYGLQRVYGAPRRGRILDFSGQCVTHGGLGTTIRSQECPTVSHGPWSHRIGRSGISLGNNSWTMAIGPANGRPITLRATDKFAVQNFQMYDIALIGNGGQAMTALPSGEVRREWDPYLSGIGGWVEYPTIPTHQRVGMMPAQRASHQWRIRTDGTIRHENGWCLTMRPNASGSYVSGSEVQTRACTGNADQLWVLQQGGLINPWSRRDLCLDVRAASVEEGAQVQVFNCHGDLNQRWHVRSDIRLGTTGLCTDVYNFNTASGATLVSWSCWEGANQTFDYLF